MSEPAGWPFGTRGSLSEGIPKEKVAELAAGILSLADPQPDTCTVPLTLVYASGESTRGRLAVGSNPADDARLLVAPREGVEELVEVRVDPIDLFRITESLAHAAGALQRLAPWLKTCLDSIENLAVVLGDDETEA
jgi:hypothetical protein